MEPMFPQFLYPFLAPDTVAPNNEQPVFEFVGYTEDDNGTNTNVALYDSTDTTSKRLLEENIFSNPAPPARFLTKRK